MTNMLAFMEDRKLRFSLVPLVMKLAVEVYPQVDAAVKDFCDKHPDLEERYGQKYILKVALKLRKSEEPTKSLEYQPLFDTFNGIYFGDHLPAYWVRAVYDINAFFQVFWDHDYVHDGHLLDGHLPDGLILPESRTIYLRIMGDPLMPGTLVHEMAHAATRSGHDERFWAEIGRLHAAGAPVLGFELRKLTALKRKKARNQSVQAAG